MANQTDKIISGIQAVDAHGMLRNKVPFIVNVEPNAQVAAGAVVVVRWTNGTGRIFWNTHIGHTTQGVVWPGGGGQPFKINIQDESFSHFYGPTRWLARGVIGSNPNTSDNAAFELPVAYPFEKQVTVTVEFENIGTINCLPYLELVGYLE